MEWDTGDDEGRFLLARGWADEVKNQPPRHSPSSLDDFLNAVAEKDHQALAMRFKATLAEDPSGTTGGYLVPPELAEGVLAVAGPKAVLRRATPLVMTEEFLKVPALDPTLGAVVTGDTSLFGQARVQWNAEATQPANDYPPALAQLELRANQALSQFDLSEALNADMGQARRQILLRHLFNPHLWELERAFLVGTGAGQPSGALNSGCAVAVSRQTAGSVTLQDCGKMMARMLPGWSPAQALWVAHPSCAEKLLQLAAGARSSDPDDDCPVSLFGVGVHFSEVLQPLGTAKDFCLLDCRHYAVGVRLLFAVGASRAPRFFKNQVTWRLYSRRSARCRGGRPAGPARRTAGCGRCPSSPGSGGEEDSTATERRPKSAFLAPFWRSWCLGHLFLT
jgi:HK97 family phage major capsid protein